jgi:hypothetical protein
VQLPQKRDGRYGLRRRERKIGERRGQHRGRARGPAELSEHDRNLAKPAFFGIAAEGGNALSNELGPNRRNLTRRRSGPDAVGIPLFAKESAHGLPEHLRNIVGREPCCVHGTD